MADDQSRAGQRYATEDILAWVNQVHAGHDAGLARAFATPADMPAIMVGPSEGRLLSLLLRMIGARKVVEVGTLAGYSAIHMARALPPDGHLWTVEYEPHHADVARGNVAAAGLADRISVHVGAGLDVLPTLSAHGPFDAVFLDADKGNYDGYARWALQHLRPGGLILGDNAYLFGELLTDNRTGEAMRAFHALVAERCDSVCIPTPDGLVVGIVR